MNYKVSVIVPVCNVENYIRDCVDSLINQDYKNMEIILVDDGSTDSSSTILDSYKNNYIKVFHTKNGGVSCARNFGISKSTGDYIMFVDGDDYVKNNFVSLMVNKMLKNKLDVLACGYELVDENGKIIEEINLKNKKDNYLILISSINPSCGFLCNKIYRKEVLKDFKLNENSNILEDMEFNIRISNNVKKYDVISDSLYCYRQRNNSALKNKKIKNYNYLNSLPYIIKELNNNNISSDIYRRIYIVRGKEILNTNKELTKDQIRNIKDNINKYKRNLSLEGISKRDKLEFYLWNYFPLIMKLRG